MNGLAHLAHKMGWDKDIQSPKKDAPKNTSETASPELTAAISAAVTEYRKERGPLQQKTLPYSKKHLIQKNLTVCPYRRYHNIPYA
jgi:hypothetical protein